MSENETTNAPTQVQKPAEQTRQRQRASGDKPKAVSGGWEAKLVNGGSYTYKGRTFLNGVSVPVSEEEKDYLKANAIDKVTVTGGGSGAKAMERQKFEFSKGK